MWATLLITAVIVGIAVVLLAIKIIFVKGGKFPNTHLSGNKAMRKVGIGCAKSMDKELQEQKKLKDHLEEERNKK